MGVGRREGTQRGRVGIFREEEREKKQYNAASEKPRKRSKLTTTE